jgi:IMP dehydrogenase/GMP reductase
MSQPKISKIAYQGLTFDDVLVLPRYSEVLPRDTNTKTRLTKKLSINIPIISAAMDTVTESNLAIAIAREGGIGIVHKNMSIAEQAAEIKKVKRSESGMIKDPVTLKSTNTLSEAVNVMKENRIGGIPIIDDNHKLVGIITNRDLRFQIDLSTPIEEVMTNSSKVLVDTEGGNNMLYLPLDKIIQQGSSGGTLRSSGTSEQMVDRIANEVIEKLQRNSDRVQPERRR